ncbi:flagellar biosynthetic protein FliO [Haloimpatiens massiliensis]|uniref:flagellar biosynthetic protein FliO n=1 Tax=Haloimpatiens massiliensis TaxID=1658110 RepID=UPI000C85FDD6|nr:flagellar biosynthetic protein FliO [Haloimpatiens massiliensis]
MDKEFFMMIIKLICFFPFILLSIYLVLKYGGSKIGNMQNGKYIKIFERVQLSKDNSILVVKIGQKGYVISNTNKGIEILMPVSEEELLEIEKGKKIPQYKDLKEFYGRFKKRKE